MSKEIIKEGKEALNRALLMMKYDMSKTLTENKVESKNLINEGIYSNVKTILDGCSTNPGGVYLGGQHADIASKFVKAFGDMMGTNNELWREGLKLMSGGGYGDLCEISKSYEEQAGESFIEGIDADIDYDSEWSEFSATFVKMRDKEKNAPISKKDSQAQNIDYFNKAYDCLFKSNSVNDRKVYTDANGYSYIWIQGTKDKYMLFSDGRIKTKDGKPTYKKVQCSGSKVSFVNESNIKKKLIEQFDDTELQKTTQSGTKTQSQSSTQQFTSCPKGGPYTQGCKSDVVKQIQGCLGVKQTGNFGPLTQKALSNVGYNKGFKDADIDTICKNSNQFDVVFTVTADKGI